MPALSSAEVRGKDGTGREISRYVGYGSVLKATAGEKGGVVRGSTASCPLSQTSV